MPMTKRSNKKRIERGRWTSQRKMDVVLRLLRGEDLDAVPRELQVKATSLAEETVGNSVYEVLSACRVLGPLYSKRRVRVGVWLFCTGG